VTPFNARRPSFAAAALIAVVGAAGLLHVAPMAQVPAPGQSPDLISNPAEPQQGLDVRRTSPASGFVTFAARRGLGLRLAVPASAPAADRALAFIDTYGQRFGISSRAGVTVVGPPAVDALGIEHVTLRQVHQGVPVTAGELRVHLRGDRVVGANGEIVGQLPAVVTPGLSPLFAEQTARLLVDRYRPAQAPGAVYSQPRLEIFNSGVFDDVAAGAPSRLAWFVEVTGSALREYVWVDANTGELLLSFSQLTLAKQRQVYDAAGTGTLPGTLVRAEGWAATGDPDQDGAYDLSGATYDYFFNTFGRDSYDAAGAALVSATDYCPSGSCPFSAAWNGTQLLFGDQFAAVDDVVAHEITHGVIEHSADLFYYSQSGALNESYADIFGETVDLTDGVGNDTAGVRWRLGEDVPVTLGGAVRDMMTPTMFNDPGKLSDSEFRCFIQGWTDPTEDQGGIHHNSGVPNHAFALMADGGTYNGYAVTGIGLTKAARIQYRALTTYLTSGAGFLDNYLAVSQACSDLVGTYGITVSDCTQVVAALDAVEMADPLRCAASFQKVPVCPAGSTLRTTAFADDFETGTSNSNWTDRIEVGSSSWAVTTAFASGGQWAAYGANPDKATEYYIELATGVLVPAGGRLYFEHAFEFESNGIAGGEAYDGGVIEYSEDGGSTWVDLGSLIEDGQPYGGTLRTPSSNPLAGRPAFVRTSFGYTSTRVDLSSLAGKTILIRFGVGTDAVFGSLGWLIDNVQISACGSRAVDLDGDGNGDVFAYQSSTGAWNRAVAQSGGGFGETLGSWVAGWSLWPATFDGDGLTDLFLSSPTTGRWFRMTNTGTGFATQATGVWWPGWQKFVLDLDGDGLSDVFLYDPATGQWYTCLSTPTGFTYHLGRWSPGWEVVPMHLNGDAADDLFLFDRTTGRWFWVLSQAGGGFTYPQTSFWATDWAFHPGDFNGDGLDDLFLYREAAGQYYVALNSGAGYTYTFGAGWAPGWTPTVADLDGNGDDDLFLYNPTTGRWFELLGDGAGHFSAAGFGFWSPGWDLYPTDFNADGRADLLLYSPTTGIWYQARNLTLGSFSFSSGYWGPGMTIVTGSAGR